MAVNAAVAHPRVGGENFVEPGLPASGAGSSPRGRGKQPMVRNGRIHGGLIPAWAGKTLSGVGLGQTRWAHPRVGGENYERKTGEPITCGSSPRGRGKLLSAVADRRPDRLIPAWAGKTTPRSTRPGARWAHPRVGGENTKTRMSPGLTVGSSPRGRGKHFALIDVLFEERLIPAWAGKTILSPGLNCAHRAHPRVGGENGQGDGLSAVARGSSPRGRGKLVVVVLGVVEFGLIPAWAGKTQTK